MSRIGKKQIEIPAGVTASKSGAVLTLTGPKGTIVRRIRPEVEVFVEGGRILVKPAQDRRDTAAYWGMIRSLIARAVEGVSSGFEKKLEIEGVGYRVQLEGSALVFSLGFSHPVRFDAPAGIAFKADKNVITVAGIDAELVGDVAARIRNLRPPEPYKGKGVRYKGEIIRRKDGKKAVSAGG